MDLLDAVLLFFIAYGYVFLFLATTCENIPIIGAFMPGEVIVVAAGFFASSGDFNLTSVILIACAGAFLGSIISYGLGLWGGRALLERIAEKLRMNGDRLTAADRYFSTHGPVTVFVGRYMSGVKAFVPALAGTHRMSFGRFAVFSSLGIISWTVAASLLGYYFGRNWDRLIGVFKAAGWAVPVIVILILCSIWLVQKRRSTRRE